jgi:phosphatidylinositol alpha-1,6-mannosyltransferase
MRVLFLTQDWPPPFRGGSLILFHALYQHWPEALVVMTGGEEARAPAGERVRFLVYPYILPSYRAAPWRQKIGMLLRWAWESWGVMRQGEFDLIHAGQLFPTGLVGLWLSLVMGRPLVQWIMGEEVAALPSLRGVHRLRTWASDLVLRRAARVVTISEASAALVPQGDDMRGSGVAAGRVHIIQPGFDAAGFARGADGAALRAELGLGSRPVMLTVGRLTRRKGQDMVLSALPRIRAAVPDVVYLVVGAPAEGESLDLAGMAAQLGVSEQVRLLGPVAPERLASLYAAADLFVMPNRTLPNGDTEGFGLVFLEANALGKPVIGGRAGGALEAIADGESGLLVDGSQPEEIAAAAIRLLTDQALAQQLGEQGRQRALAWPSWQAAAETLYALSLEVCESWE